MLDQCMYLPVQILVFSESLPHRRSNYCNQIECEHPTTISKRLSTLEYPQKKPPSNTVTKMEVAFVMLHFCCITGSITPVFSDSLC